MVGSLSRISRGNRKRDNSSSTPESKSQIHSHNHRIRVPQTITTRAHLGVGARERLAIRQLGNVVHVHVVDRVDTAWIVMEQGTLRIGHGR